MSDFFGSVDEFVRWSGGDHAIRKVLIANNGIGATKAIRSVRRWCYEVFGDERIIKFVVMATPEDMRANAEYIRLADEVVDVPGGSNNNNYANVNLICELAERHRVDAVMPLWGHASENPSLPTSLLALPHRVTFIGPPAAPMQALGDKIGSTIIAQSANVPTIAWNANDLRVDYQKEGIPDEIYAQANVLTAEDALEHVKAIGLPVMIKASEGGGGKGIRKVLRLEDTKDLFRQVQAEIPGSPIFLMKMATGARHLEVQLLADKYGDAIALSGRDCSVQRRHQKIIEEGPPTIASPDIFRKMEQAAVSLAKTVGYCNAGTVEYLFMEETNEFAFLELNPRLQVEHPVTENILGINLPACQIQVAMGIPLSRIADVRRIYGRHPRGRDTIDFDFAERTVAPRHCIAVRVTAENPDAGFQPTSGMIKELQFRSSPGVWGYFSVDNSGLVHEFADSQFGHIFSGARDRETARRAMIVALKELQIRGELRTTIEYIIKMLQSEDFINNKFNTDWLDGRLANFQEVAAIENAKYCPPPTLVAFAGAALQGYRKIAERDEGFRAMLKVGQVPSIDMLSPKENIDLIFNNTKYITSCVQSGAESVVVSCNGKSGLVGIRPLSDGGYMMKIFGGNHVAYVQDESDGSLRMILDGHTCIFTPEYDPTRFISSVAGKIVRLLVDDGAHVKAGEPFVEIEVMKMYMPLRAQESGHVFFMKSEGATLSPGDMIARVELDDPDLVVKAELFTGNLLDFVSTLGDIMEPSTLPHIVVRESQARLESVLQGFPLTKEDICSTLNTMLTAMKHPLLPFYEVEEALAVVRGRIDSDLMQSISDQNQQFRSKYTSNPANFSEAYPAASITSLIVTYFRSLSIEKRQAFNKLIHPLMLAVQPYIFNLDERILDKLVIQMNGYLDVEELFDDMSYTDVVTRLRKDPNNTVESVFQSCSAHANIKCKNFLMLELIEATRGHAKSNQELLDLPLDIPLFYEPQGNKLRRTLLRLSKLQQSVCSQVSFAANLLLVDRSQLSSDGRRENLHKFIVSLINSGDCLGDVNRVKQLVRFCGNGIVLRDLIIDALRQASDYQVAVLELYIRYIYQKSHSLSHLNSGVSLVVDDLDHNTWITFDFMSFQVLPLPVERQAGGETLSVSDITAALNTTDGAYSMSTVSEMQPFYPAGVRTPSDELRHGVIATIGSFNDLPMYFYRIISKIPPTVRSEENLNVVHVVVKAENFSGSDEEMSELLGNFLVTQSKDLAARNIRRVTFFVGRGSINGKPVMPSILTFRSRTSFYEDRLFRHVEAPHAFHLDLPRLSNFDIVLEDGIQTSSGNVHLYRATPKDKSNRTTRYFARIVSFSASNNESEMERLFVETLDGLGLAQSQQVLFNAPKSNIKNSSNHIFLNVVDPESVCHPDTFELQIREIMQKYSNKLVKLGVTTVELKMTFKVPSCAYPLSFRLVLSNPTGFALRVYKYIEIVSSGRTIFRTISKLAGEHYLTESAEEPTHKGPWDGLDTQTPYATTQEFESRRAEAQASTDTLFVYDWPTIFESALEQSWRNFSGTVPCKRLFTCAELVLCDESGTPLKKGWVAKDADSAQLLPLENYSPAQNDVGMVAWLLTLCTPEYPEGRQMVVISNDITFQAGSFGTKEDALFYKASTYARERGIPRIFLAANSGARIGMAQSLKNKFEIAWIDPSDSTKGFKYIFLNESTYLALLDKVGGRVVDLPVIVTRIEEETASGSEVRYVINDIIGEEPDLGVENLMGSGLIAGETARAYNDIFTLTLVVGRSVGIGAYLIRLGQRTIQKTKNAPIILTGYQALNKLMGRDIYTTNDQLGGPMIMFPNGVSHLLADDHLDAVSNCLNWLSYVPKQRGGSLPIRNITGHDIIERPVEYSPVKGEAYDPRLLLTGDAQLKGFLDAGSFVETLCGWAKTVVVGRGRLGGIPIGAILTENRTSEALKPADPADLTSEEKLVQQAGGVWFPDSAYKTAQALRDFNREGLPCIIFANWRGFSGGQRDMFDEVLKFGSMIVDALVAYEQPLFVYIPPFAELRGGAWVVVDSTINADVMEFYAAENARGGVLEPTGAASIKFRERDVIATAHRLDAKLQKLDADLAAASDEEKVSIQAAIKKREKAIFGVYQQIAVHFADLHDTPGRMKSKGVIRDLIPWKDSRKYFFWRLSRRLQEFELYKAASMRGGSNLKVPSRKEFVSQLETFFHNKGITNAWGNDQATLALYKQHNEVVQEFLLSMKCVHTSAVIAAELNVIAKFDSNDAVDVLRSALANLTPEQKALLEAALY